MDIQRLIKESHDTALEKGWYDPPKTFTECIALFHSEISEALEEFRDGRHVTEVYWTISTEQGKTRRTLSDEDFHNLLPDLQAEFLERGLAKPEGVPIELADALIRIADTCGFYGIDLVKALELKLAYNKTRPVRHGGKVV